MVFFFMGLVCVISLAMYRVVHTVQIGRKLKAYDYWVFPDSLVSRAFVPSWIMIPWVIYGNNRACLVKHSEFARAGADGYVQMSFADPAAPYLFLADPQAIKEITRSRSGVIQEMQGANMIAGMFGSNMITLEGDAWKHHRRIVQRAFTEKNVQLVWSESVLVTEQLLEQWDRDYGQVVHIHDLSHITETLALMVISSAALGQRMSWKEEPNENIPPGYSVSFQRAIITASSSILLRVLIPHWADGLTTATRNMSEGFKDFRKYLRNMMVSYRQRGRLDQSLTGTIEIPMTQTANVFSVLMSASEEDQTASGKGLTDDEVAGNAFLVLFAGHETTAHALSFAFGLLALYPEVQNEVYAQVKLVLGSRKSLEYGDLNNLGLVTGTFLESLRMYPVIPQIYKATEKDIVVSVARNGPGTDENDRVNVAVPVGSNVIISTLSTHYNPRYWLEPEEFRPARFCEAYNKDAFLPFGAGRRICVGKRFAETEGTAVIATILAKYEISVDVSKFPAIPGETIQARRDRLLRPSHFITMTPKNMPLVFTRR